MAQHSELAGSSGSGSLERVAGALEFIENILKTDTHFKKQNPSVALKVESVTTEDKQYLAHEYFNKDWQPMYFSEIADSLGPAKLEYACSASYFSQLDHLNLTSAQSEFLAKISNAKLRQSARDIILNTQFRQDYWIKGPSKLTSLEQMEILKHERVILCSNPSDVPSKISCPVGEAKLNETIYQSILAFLSDFKVHSIGELFDATQNKGMTLPLVVEAIMTLTHLNHVAAVQIDEGLVERIISCDKLNDHFISLSRSRLDISFLASPVTGGGVSVSRIEQLFLLSMKADCTTPESIADFVWNILEFQGHQVFKDGKTLEGRNQSVAELMELAESFKEKRLPILEGLKVIPNS